MIPNLMTTPQVAQKFRITHAHLNTLIRDGELGELPERKVANLRVWTPEDMELLRSRLLQFCRRNKKFYSIALEIAKKYETVLTTGIDPLLTMNQVAEELQVKPTLVREWLNRRSDQNMGCRLRPAERDGRLGLFDWKSLHEWAVKVTDWLDTQYAGEDLIREAVSQATDILLAENEDHAHECEVECEKIAK
jgi:hypothetical protein